MRPGSRTIPSTRAKAGRRSPGIRRRCPFDPQLVQEARERNDAALVILGRTAGEDKDNSAEEGSYLLAAAERQVLEQVCKTFPGWLWC